MNFKEVYCFDCKKSLGIYNERYFSDTKLTEIIRIIHDSHVREGHQITVRRVNPKKRVRDSGV